MAQGLAIGLFRRLERNVLRLGRVLLRQWRRAGGGKPADGAASEKLDALRRAYPGAPEQWLQSIAARMTRLDPEMSPGLPQRPASAQAQAPQARPSTHAPAQDPRSGGEAGQRCPDPRQSPRPPRSPGPFQTPWRMLRPAAAAPAPAVAPSPGRAAARTREPEQQPRNLGSPRRTPLRLSTLHQPDRPRAAHDRVATPASLAAVTAIASLPVAGVLPPVATRAAPATSPPDKAGAADIHRTFLPVQEHPAPPAAGPSVPGQPRDPGALPLPRRWPVPADNAQEHRPGTGEAAPDARDGLATHPAPVPDFPPLPASGASRRAVTGHAPASPQAVRNPVPVLPTADSPAMPCPWPALPASPMQAAQGTTPVAGDWRARLHREQEAGAWSA